MIANALSRQGAASRTSSAGCWSPAAPAPAWRRPMASRWAARCSRWRCCAACWRLRLVLPALLTSLIATARVVAGAARCADLRHPALRRLDSPIWLWRCSSDRSPDWCRWRSCARSPGPTATGRSGWRRLVAPMRGARLARAWFRSRFPQLLGNGKDVAQLAFADQIAPALLLALLAAQAAPRPCCAWEAARPAACSRRRWRWAPCSAAPSAMPGRWLWPGCSPRLVRGHRRRRRAGGHHARTDLGGRADDGADRPRPLVHCAVAAGGRDRRPWSRGRSSRVRSTMRG